MDLAWYIYPLAILAGVVAGIINTLAGSGSAVTLPMLVFMGLPPTVANGTNRVGVIVQNVVGIVTFQRRGKLDASGSMWFSAPAVLGAIVGARIAVDLDERTMNYAIGIVMVIILFMVLFDPKQWLREQSEIRAGRPKAWLLLVFFVIGMYGGFIQAGVGIFLLTALVMGAGYALAHANAVKLVIVLAFSIAAILVFIAITTSSSEQFPARSPMPLIVHSIWPAPFSTAARLLATASPRSLLQCTLRTALSIFETRFLRMLIVSPICAGVA